MRHSLTLIHTWEAPHSKLDTVFLFYKYFQKTGAYIGDE